MGSISTVANTPTPPRLAFDWGRVSEPTLRALLEHDHVFAEAPGPKKGPRLRARAVQVFGDRPSYGRVERAQAWGGLDRWIEREASLDQLRKLAHLQQRATPKRREPVAELSKPRLRAFLLGVDWSEGDKKRVLQAFVAAHRTPKPVNPATPAVAARAFRTGVRLLEGREESARPHLAHQADARKELDRFARTRSDRSGLLVLPTGAGKTFTAVRWLLDCMSRDKGLKVLWLAHQQELVEQAAITFEQEARSFPSTFRRRMRVVSGAHDLVTTINGDIDIAVATWQSFSRAWGSRDRKRLRDLLSGRSIVIVDEAHHAAAPSYQSILKVVLSSPSTSLVGLTATPWPTGYARQRLHETFPRRIHEVSVEALHASGVLATPILHTVETGSHVHLTSGELQQAKLDLPAVVLRRLVGDQRNELITRAWLRDARRWGKTLLYATSRGHADDLGYLLAKAGAEVRVLHTGFSRERGDILEWFRRHRGPCVLVSVGMLTEGIDLPDARTAFLARPTTSRILMRQMIGRVLRGPHAGGEEQAHIVYFRDQWTNFDDVLDPLEVPGVEVAPTAGTDGGEYQLPPIIDETETVIPEDLLAAVRRMYAARTGRIPIDPATTTTVLAGFYETEQGKVPVLEHQLEAYEELLSWAVGNYSFQGNPKLSFFDDLHPPYPTSRQVAALTDHAATYRSKPPFVAIRATLSPNLVAQQMRKLPAMTDDERQEWLRDRFNRSLARVSYRTFEHFEDAVERELRELRRLSANESRRLDPERVSAGPRPSLPKLRRARERPLPSRAAVVRCMHEIFEGEPVATHLGERDDVTVDWTRRPISSAWAYWSLRTTGKGAGKPVIRINRALQAPRRHVSDEMLEYLLFHELLHDLLPGQGHDAEFRRLEAMWPNAAELDYAFDTLHEQFDLTAAKR